MPTIELVADNYSIPYGGSTILHWTSVNATSCYASGGGSTGWAGPKNLTGSFLTGALYNTTTFWIMASNGTYNIATFVTIIIQNQPTINIPTRIVGTGTYVQIPMYISGNTGNLHGFQLSVYYNGIAKPQSFEIGQIFYNYPNYWTYYPEIVDGNLEVAAVGNPIPVKNENKIGDIGFHIGQYISGTYSYPYTNFFDGNNNWTVTYGNLQIINLPIERYGDPNNDGLKNISDVFINWDIVGTTSGDDETDLSIDLDGDGLHTTYDVRLHLMSIVNPVNINYWPIFNNYCYGKNKPMLLEWRLSNNKWGLFSNDTITNGDLVGLGNLNNISLPANNNSMFKKMENKIYFAGSNAIIPGNPILVTTVPITLTGTVNEGRPISVSISSPTDVEENETIPTEFALSQNYPNPFNPSTTINYKIPTNYFVNLKIYDILGNEIAILVNEEKTAGSYSVNFNATNLPSGTYIYKITAGNFIETKKMVLMK